MMWTINDPVIEDHRFLEKQFNDIAGAGFGGVAAMVRCSRYSWLDPMALSALARISEMCHRYDIAFWLGLDPRGISRHCLDESAGLKVLRCDVESSTGDVPFTISLNEGVFSGRVNVSPRPVHTIPEGAITYQPIGIAKCFAVNDAGPPVDITERTRHYFNALENYVECFGAFDPVEQGVWRILPFLACVTNQYDFFNPVHRELYHEALTIVKSSKIELDGCFWDEPGFTAGYGVFPVSPELKDRYYHATGNSFHEDVWKLVLNARDGSHAAARKRYFSLLQETVTDAKEEAVAVIRKLWGKETVFGIHDTWHWESADMSDMNHGSLDLWKAGKKNSCGFVDLGSANLLEDGNSDFYANLAAVSAVGLSLGRRSILRTAFNNLWVYDSGKLPEIQNRVLGHCVDVMALFGLRWLAHIYGPAGRIGEESSFLGLPFTPGYPFHCTWRDVPEWNRKLIAHFRTVEQRLPERNLLLVFPVESMYAETFYHADSMARSIFELVLTLTDAHYHVEITSTSALENLTWKDGLFRDGAFTYEVAIAPYPSGIPDPIRTVLGKGRGRVLHVFEYPQQAPGDRAGQSRLSGRGGTIAEVLPWLSQFPGLRPVKAPARSWVSLTRVSDGYVVSLVPSRFGYKYKGRVSFQGRSIDLNEQKRLVRVLFSDEDKVCLL